MLEVIGFIENNINQPKIKDDKARIKKFSYLNIQKL